MNPAQTLARDADMPTPAAQLHAAAIVLRLRGLGIADRHLVRAMETIPRSLFVPAALERYAHVDRDIPIPCGQTLSAYSTIARMISALGLGDRHSVMEIGTGSGYQTAILGELARRVTTIERFRTLSRSAAERLTALDIRNVTVLVGDGCAGWAPQAPFDRILVAAACPAPPLALLNQLAEDGVLVAPIDAAGAQRLTIFRRTGSRIATRDAGEMRMQAIVPGPAHSL